MQENEKASEQRMNEFFETHHYDEKPKVDWQVYFDTDDDFDE